MKTKLEKYKFDTSKYIKLPRIMFGKTKKPVPLKWLWHEQSNLMCVADLSIEYVPLITVCEESFEWLEPFRAYPYELLIKYFGFVEIGEL